MNFTFTKELIYKNCADRISRAIVDTGISHRKIYKQESKIIGRIRKCIIVPSRNPYLIPDNVRDALKKELPFDTEQDLLWGTKDEVSSFLPVIFQHLIFDLIANKSDYKDLINKILCNYIPYARYRAYYHILYETPSPIPNQFMTALYDVDNIDMIMTIDSYTDSAISYLFRMCREDFKDSFFRFMEINDSFKKLDKRLNKWVDTDLISILRQYTPSETSLGHRIESLISCDYSYLPLISSSKISEKSEAPVMQQIISATDQYVSALEAIQKNYPTHTFFNFIKEPVT